MCRQHTSIQIRRETLNTRGFNGINGCIWHVLALLSIFIRAKILILRCSHGTAYILLSRSQRTNDKGK